jgi:Abortive infection alpha
MPQLLAEHDAKVIEKGIEAGQQFGGFFAKHFGGSVEQWAGLWEDKLRYRRWENQLALMQKAEEKIRDLGLGGHTKPLSFKIGVPLLEAASLEEDDYLRELWANLLINSVRQDQETTHPAYVQVLQQLLPEEAKLLAYAAENKSSDIVLEETEKSNAFMDTAGAYVKMITFAEEARLIDYTDEQVFSWYDNLIRLELLKRVNAVDLELLSKAWSSGDLITRYYDGIWITTFGRNFINAVTLKEDKS